MSGHESPADREGRILIRHGTHAEVLDDEGTVVSCPLQRRLGDLVCGDRVRWQREGGAGRLTERLPRTSELVRASRGRPRPLAANIDWVGVVVSPAPGIDPDDIDRYLIACELSGLPARLLLNKADTLDAEARRRVGEPLDEFRALGVPILHTSSIDGEGLDELRDWLTGATAVLVGASGAGKTSLTNALTGEANRVGDLSRSGHGRHTTSTTHLLPVTGGGTLIDSPGVRAFGIEHVPPEQVVDGFPEFRERAEQCRFRDCRHLAEPDCAVRAAVEEGAISARRYHHYRRLRQGDPA
ncbi:MAG: ribosome small subunit-dependent GTPase A [Pseudomonadota bacterium]